jgi:hypothetical protein
LDRARCSGAPLSLSAVGAFNTAGNNTPVAASDVSNGLGEVTRVGNGVVYFDGLKQVVDPYVAQITPINEIQQRSTLLAVMDASGKLLLVNPQPGQLGTVAPRFFTGPRLFQIDLNLLKRFRFKERYDFYIRADAINVTNTVNFGNPDTNINSADFRSHHWNWNEWGFNSTRGCAKRPLQLLRRARSMRHSPVSGAGGPVAAYALDGRALRKWRSGS